MNPTQAGFLTFVRSQMGISVIVLPDSSEYLTWAYSQASELVNQGIQCASPLIYMLAVYNLAASNLVNFTPDQTGQTVFAQMRESFGVNSFVAGVIQSSSDVSTSSSFVVPEALQNLTLADLQLLKDPWGRQYLASAQKYGTIWGLS